MISLKPRDAAILAKIAQYEQLPKPYRMKMLTSLSTETAKRIGRLIIKNSRTGAAEHLRTARLFTTWARTNKEFARERRSRPAASAR